MEAASDTDDGNDSSEEHVDTRKYKIPDTEHMSFGWPTKHQQRDYTFTSLSRDHTSLPRLHNHHVSDTPTVTPTPTSTTTATATATAADTDDSNHDSNHDSDLDDTYWTGAPLSRPASILSLSRLSFTSQLAELTSIKLPSAVSLSVKISSMPTSAAAVKALSDSAEQIQVWIRNALTVLRGLNADDDVEWAAAAGREGLHEVDKAISRFERVIKLYVLSVEELQMRPDISQLHSRDLTANVVELEAVLKEWEKIKDALDAVKEQVEVAMEWEELWNHVLGTGISQELDDLARLVFEMEEKRHQYVAFDSTTDADPRIDLDELKTIVEEPPTRSQRYSLPPFSPTAPDSPSPALGNMEDGLLALFARMQPLRASLDFLPMRLSVFHCRGNKIFPSACLILEERRDALEAQWKKLEADAESLRRELGEDRWLLVFRNAGRQALKMCESVSRTMDKLKVAMRNGEQQTNAPAVAKKIESYEAKKTHYAPAIERVLAIIDRGVLDRLTVNGEILGLQSDMKRKWSALEADMRELDSRMLDMNVNMRNQQLRDSISTILSSEQSLGSSFVETPRSSSASSVSGRSSINNHNTPRPSGNRLFKSSLPRRRSGFFGASATSSPLAQPPRPISPTLTPVQFLRQFKPPSDKPRWNGSTNTRGSGIGHNFAPLSVTEPSPYRKEAPPCRAVTPSSAPSKIPAPSPLRYRTESPSVRFATSPGSPASVRHVSVPASSPLAIRSRSSLGFKTSSGLANSSTLPGQFQSRAVTTPVSVSRRDHLAPGHDDENDAITSRESGFRRIARAPGTLAVPSGRKSALRAASPVVDRGGSRSRASGRIIERPESRPTWR